MKSLFPQQKESLEVLVQSIEAHGAALDASDTGTGKTLKAVEISRISQTPPLVICPKIVIPAWRETFVEQGVEYLDILNYERLRTGKTRWGLWKDDRGTPRFQFPEEVQFVIWDEVHRCKGVQSQNSKMLIGAADRYNLLLSATAAEDPTEMRALGYLLKLFPDPKFFFNWAKQNGCEFDLWRNLQFKESARKSVLTELNRQLYPSRGHKVTREEMKEFFQETHIVTEPLDFGDGGKIARIYAEMEAELQELELAKEEDRKNSGAEQLVATLRARQEIELLKVPLLMELVEEYLAGRFSVAIFLNFDASIEALADKLSRGYGATPKIWGSQSAAEREESIRKFQTNESRVILCNLAAGGVGVSLHDKDGRFPRVALISPSWNAKDLLQVTGRVDRAGGKSPTLQRVLFAADTVEDKIRLALNKKLANLKTLHNKCV